MANLQLCSSCNGFLPHGAARCPNCGAQARAPQATKRRGIAGKLWAAASGGAVAITLMACYGSAPCDGGSCNSCSDSDADGDGYGTDTSICPADTVDCDDNNPDVYPGAPEIADDGIDQDCDGVDMVTSSSSSSSSGGGMGGSMNNTGGMGGMGGAGGN